ncbi:MAG: AAA domain-containing protein, partial [Phycisphaerae bacterium]|nr:AAA domain-containing protein [Phycisphaerae bacterium]
VLDDGRLTDGHGRTVDFTNTIIVMTSNIGSQRLLDMTDRGDSEDAIESAMKDMLKQSLRPELLNRIDETIVFHSLSQPQLRSIVAVQLEQLRGRMAARDLHLHVSDRAMDALADAGFDPQFGVRPLKRVIQRQIENVIAMKVLSGGLHDGQTAEVDFKDGEFTCGAGLPMVETTK